MVLNRNHANFSRSRCQYVDSWKLLFFAIAEIIDFLEFYGGRGFGRCDVLVKSGLEISLDRKNMHFCCRAALHIPLGSPPLRGLEKQE